MTERQKFKIRDLMAENRHLRAELAELKGKLPKTDDGVPVMPGMILWYRSPAGIIESPPVHNWDDAEDMCDDGGFYGTREAAEKARRA